MAKRLSANLTSQYLGAAQELNSRRARRKIIAYVESYDDIWFWRSILNRFETQERYFEVMLPSRDSLSKGKKKAIMNVLGAQLGQNMIACVDADYDYLLQNTTETSRIVNTNPYVFHTYAYAIENHQCYAESLHNVCVMATLNDRNILNFPAFMSSYSEIMYPLFVWSIWCYRKGFYREFPMADLCSTVAVENMSLHHPERTLESLRHRVNKKINWLQNRFPQAKSDYSRLKEELTDLGVTPPTTYLYMRGHDVSDNIVLPVLETVCDALRREREREIRQLAGHEQQMQNELAGYQHSSSSPAEMLRKHTGYHESPLYQHILHDLEKFFNNKMKRQGS